MCPDVFRPQTDDEGPPKRNSELELTIRRKAKEVGERLEALGEEGLETRLATAQPSPSPHLLVRRVAVLAERGCPAILVEVGRPHGDSGPQDVANLGVTVLQAGAHGLAVRTSSEDSPDGLSDLTAVTRCETC